MLGGGLTHDLYVQAIHGHPDSGDGGLRLALSGVGGRDDHHRRWIDLIENRPEGIGTSRGRRDQEARRHRERRVSGQHRRETTRAAHLRFEEGLDVVRLAVDRADAHHVVGRIAEERLQGVAHLVGENLVEAEDHEDLQLLQIDGGVLAEREQVGGGAGHDGHRAGG